MADDTALPTSAFVEAYTAYQPFSDPAATVEMDQVEFEAWTHDHDMAAAQLAAAEARSAGELALKLEAAVELFEANAIDEDGTMSEAEALLLRACLRDAWSLAAGDARRPGVDPIAPRRQRQLSQRARKTCAQSAQILARARHLVRKAYKLTRLE